MSETINKAWLEDESGNKLAPRTLTSAIQDENGKIFQEYVDNMITISGDETVDMSEDVITPITNHDIHNIVSDAYDNTATYEMGDYCIYNNILYKCITAITTAEEFDSSKWQQTDCGTEFNALNSKLSLSAANVRFTDTSNGGKTINLIIYKRANIITATLQGILVPTATGTHYTLTGELPEHLRPIAGIFADIPLINQNIIKGHARLTISNNGTVSYTSSVAGANEFNCSVAWIVND